MLALFGMIFFVMGGNMVIAVLFDSGEHVQVVRQTGLFLIGLSFLLFVWSGAVLSYRSRTVPNLRDKEHEKEEAMLPVKGQCPHCNAVYVYSLSKTEYARTVTCQNCGRRFEVVESLDTSEATR
jgi:hypothetical protein